MDNNLYRKTVSFANSTQSDSNNNNNNYGRQTYNSYNSNFNQQNIVKQPQSTAYNPQTSYNVRPSVVNTTTTFNQGSSQVFIKNSSNVFTSNSILGRNPSVVVKPDSLVKIEIYSPELNGTFNRHYSARLACFIKSLNTLRARDNSLIENSFVNGGVWAKTFQNRNSVTIVINGTHIVENFPMTIFNEDPNWNFHNEIKTYRRHFIDTISQFSGCNFLTKIDVY